MSMSIDIFHIKNKNSLLIFVSKLVVTTLILMSISTAQSGTAGPENYCDSTKNHNNPLCEAAKLLENSTIPEFTDSNAGIRLVNAGYSVYSTGKHTEQLVVVNYVRNKDLKKTMNLPNKICAIYVKPDNKQEKQHIKHAIAELKLGIVPQNNPAYQWAQNYKFESMDCREYSSQIIKHHISSADNNWKLSESTDAYVFMAKNWLGKENMLLLIHKK